jgi:hypothetical protein
MKLLIMHFSLTFCNFRPSSAQMFSSAPCLAFSDLFALVLLVYSYLTAYAMVATVCIPSGEFDRMWKEPLWSGDMPGWDGESNNLSR